MDGDETLGSQEGNPLNFTSSIKFTMEPHPPMGVSGSSFPPNTTRTRLAPITVLWLCFSCTHRVNLPVVSTRDTAGLDALG